MAPGTSSGPLTVTTAQGTAASATDFIVSGPAPAPIMDATSPPFGAAGTLVTITGSHFMLTTEIRFGGVLAPSFQIAANGSALLTLDRLT